MILQPVMIVGVVSFVVECVITESVSLLQAKLRRLTSNQGKHLSGDLLRCDSRFLLNRFFAMVT